MNKLWSLFSVQFSNAYGLSRLTAANKNEKSRRKAITSVCLYAVLAVYMCAYFFTAMYGIGGELLRLGRITSLAPLAISMSMFLMLMLSILRSGGYFFNCKDYELLSAMPLKAREVFFAKFLMLYTELLMYSLVFAVPCAVCCGIYFAPPWSFYVLFFIMYLFAPAVPVAAGCLLSFLLTRITVSSRFKTVLQLMGSILLVGFAFTLSYSMGSFLEPSESFIGAEAMYKAAYAHPLAHMFERAATGPSLVDFLLFVAINAAILTVMILIIGSSFARLNSRINEKRLSSNYKGGSLAVASSFSALLRKERKYYFSQPNYIMNCSIGMLLLIAASVYVLIAGDQALGVFGGLGIGINPIYMIGLPIISFAAGVTSTTAHSVSLEGSNLWIIESIPVRAKTIFDAKIALNLLINLPCLLVASVLFGIGLKLPILDVALLFGYGAGVTCLVSMVGLLANLANPKFDWVNPITVIKQGIPVFLTMLCGFVLTGISVAALFLIPLSEQYVCAALVFVLFAVAISLYANLAKKAPKKLISLSDV